MSDELEVTVEEHVERGQGERFTTYAVTVMRKGDREKNIYGNSKEESEQLSLQVRRLLDLALAKRATAKKEGDVFVDLGNMMASKLEQVDADDDFETMVEDFIGGFNNIVTQGITPMKALFAFASAFALTLGACVRAGLRVTVGAKLIGMIVKNADASGKMVKIITRDKLN